MAGKAIDIDTPIRDPKVGDKVRTESGGEGKIISNSSHLEASHSHSIKVEYEPYVHSEKHGYRRHHLKEASYKKVYNRKKNHVPKIGTLAQRQKEEKQLARIWASGLYQARREVKELSPRPQYRYQSWVQMEKRSQRCFQNAAQTWQMIAPRGIATLWV